MTNRDGTHPSLLILVQSRTDSSIPLVLLGFFCLEEGGGGELGERESSPTEQCRQSHPPAQLLSQLGQQWGVALRVPSQGAPSGPQPHLASLQAKALTRKAKVLVQL